MLVHCKNIRGSALLNSLILNTAKNAAKSSQNEKCGCPRLDFRPVDSIALPVPGWLFRQGGR